MVNYLVIGAGLQGTAISYDLRKFDPNSEITVVDKEYEKALYLKNSIDNIFVPELSVNIESEDKIVPCIEANDIIINASNYYNYELTKFAVKAQKHFLDLGGNSKIVKQQFSLNRQKNKKSIVIPDCGIAPGAVSIVVKYGIDNWGMPKKIHIRVGGLPVNPEGPLMYALLFSIHGLINEYKEKVDVIRNGKIVTLDPLEELEKVQFYDKRFKINPKIFTAALTSGGSSTLTQSLEGKVEELDYKTLRFDPHWECMRVCRDLGFFIDDKEYLRDLPFKPVEMLEAHLSKLLKPTNEDMMLMKVKFTYDNEIKELSMVDFYDKRTGHTAMQRTTGYSASIIAQMIANGKIKQKGVLRIEDAIEPEYFLKEWEKRDIYLKTA